MFYTVKVALRTDTEYGLQGEASIKKYFSKTIIALIRNRPVEIRRILFFVHDAPFLRCESELRRVECNLSVHARLYRDLTSIIPPK